MIEDYIPFGYANKISRTDLEILTGTSDRINRRSIAEALEERNVVIANVDGGYFRPTESEVDRLMLNNYIRKESARAYSCISKCRRLNKILQINGQMEMFNE